MYIGVLKKNRVPDGIWTHNLRDLVGCSTTELLETLCEHTQSPVAQWRYFEVSRLSKFSDDTNLTSISFK